MTVRIVIAEDQPLMRSALRTCLEAQPDLTVVAEAGDGETAVQLAGALHPDLVIMDVRMPVLDGIEATRRIVDLDGPAPVRVLVMTTFDVDEHIIEALRAGASGFLVKDSSPEELVEAVRVIVDGQAQLSPSVTRRLLDLQAGSLRPVRDTARDSALADLTPREIEVLTLVARGLPNAEIAAALDLAPVSVKGHIRHLLAKLGFTDRVQLVVFAYEHELVRPSTPPEAAAEDAAGTRPGRPPRHRRSRFSR